MFLVTNFSYLMAVFLSFVNAFKVLFVNLMFHIIITFLI